MVAVTLTATYATAGTFVWTCPPGVTSVTVACTGGGGGGGASGAAAGSNGGGGGGGEAAAEASVPVTPNLDYTVTAGAGGAAGTQGGAGAAGGDTSFTGDAGLVVAAHGGTGGTSGNATGAGQGGLGGDGSVNSVSAAGGPADDGTPATNGGAGGGAAGVSTTTGFPGNPGVGSVAGAASLGTWPGGAGGAGSTSGGAPAPSGSAPGGGGGGALSTGTNRAGGAGGAGQVVITWAQNDPVTLTGGTDGAVCTFTAPSGAATVKAECWGGGASGFNPATSGNAGVSGASVFTGIYGGTRQAAADTFDSYVGRTPALAAQVVYLDESVWPTDGDHPQAVQTLTNMGCKVFVCFKPSRQAVLTGGATLTTEKANLAAACALYSAIPGVSWYAALWNECNAFGQHGPFGDGTQKGGPSPYGTPTAAQAAANYLAYCAAYAPTIAAAGIEVAYKPALFSDTTTLTFFPGYGGANGGCDLVIADWYGTDWIKNSIDLFGAANLEGLADAGGLPLGLGEWGASAGTAPSVADYNAFTAHFMAGWQARITAGKPIGDIIYYGGKTAGGPNVITGPADYKVSSIQQITDLLAGSTGAHGGAGGGGGEYAAESALVITGGRNYTLVVGSGGTGSASGKTTTAAGDAVTVTAHGGSVAALTTAGGAGGTGSPNTTHHPGGAGGAGATLPGGGGGGSGGTGATGNAGAAPVGFSGGLGGAAVTAGGPGGAGGVNGGNGSPPPIGPGGGGGARGANGATNGSGSDGQITLSNFAVGVGCAGGLALAPLHLAGTCTAPAGAFSLAPLHVAGTGNVCDFTQVQVGPTVGPSTTTVVPTLATPSLPGSMLKAVLQIGTTTATTAPAGWVMAASQNAGGGSGRAEVWYYPSNPGGISGASFTGGAGDTLRAFLSEYSTPAGTTQAADVTGVASGAAPSTSFPVSTAAPNTGGDLGTVVFVDKFSVGTAGTWTTPASWSPERQNTGGAAWFASYTQCGLTAATQAATGTVSVSTNQTGWAAVLATFKTVTLAAGTGAVALAPLAFSGTGTSAVSAGTVAASGALALSPIGFISPSLASTFPADPLPAMVEILINGTWTDITSFVYARDGITISSRGRPDEASTTQPAQATITLNNREGTFSPQNTSGQFYPWLVRNVQLRISVVNATTTQGAWYTGYRFWGEVPAWPPQWNTAGTDVYVQVTAAGVLQRMRQSKFSASPLARYYGNIISGAAQNPGSGLSALIPAGYWPCEDGSSSATFSSGIPGGSPMTWTGTPGLAADSNVAGSAPFAQLNSSAWTGTPGAFSSGGITFATPGTYSWTCPGGVTSVQAECWGGGGGGSNGFFGPGGGGSEYAAEPALAVTPGKAYVVVVGSGGAGGAGSFSPAGGSSGQATSFTGDAVTVTANGGKGAPRNSSGGNGAGGSGSGNAVHHNGGHGASWGNANGGSGGGGSGGSSSTGNNGHSNSGLSGGAGGSAVTGGGPGGKGGDGGLTAGPTATAGMAPSPGPGGGGGGGGFNGANQYGKPGGNGFAGQVRLTFGTSVIPNANVLRVVVDVPSTGGTNNANLAQASTSGTVATLNLIYHTGGNLELQGKNAGGSQLFTSGSKSFGANGQPLLVSCELTQSLTSVKWKLTAIKPGATAVVATYSGTQNSATLGAVTQVNVNNATTDTTATGVGHLAVQYAVDPVLNLAGAFAAYVGETAGARFLRLCEEQQVPAAILGNITDTPQMGAQPTGLLVDLLQDCENADLGLMFERRDTFGLGYRTRVSLQNQAPSVVLDYAAGQLSPPFTPTNDDQLTRNDVVATRANGGTSYEAIQATGPLSVQDPPNGAGLYGYQVTPNLFADTQLAAFAQWLLVLGTLDEFRYPVLTVNMVSPNMASGVFSAMASLDAGDFLTIVNPPAWLPPMPINQLAFGFTETLNMFEWTIAVNAVPADPYTSNDVLPTW